MLRHRGFSPRISVSFILLLLTLFAGPISRTSAEDTDVDADGMSDILVVQIQDDQSLNWSGVLADELFTTSADLGSLGQVGNHLIPAPWLDAESHQIGVVSKIAGKKKLRWTIRTGPSTQTSIEFGKPSDTFISGGDFNGNGIADAAVISSNGSALIETDPFAAGDLSEQHELKFPAAAAANGRALFLRGAAGGGDVLGLLQSVARSGGVQFVLTLRAIDGQRTKFKFSAGAVEKISDVIPIRSKNGADVLAFITAGKRTRIVVRDLTGKEVFREIYPKGTVIVGDYLPGRGQELAIYHEGAVTVVNPFDEGSEEIAGLPLGVAADHINVNTFSRKRRNPGGGGGDDDDDDDDDGGGGVPPGGDLEDVCPTVQNLHSSHIYKSIGSEHFSPSDPRRRSTAFIVEAGGFKPTVSCASMYNSAGVEIERMGYYHPAGYQWAARLYGAGTSCSTGQTSSETASKAHNGTGSYSGYLKITPNVCIRIPDLRNCYGSSQC